MGIIILHKLKCALSLSPLPLQSPLTLPTFSVLARSPLCNRTSMSPNTSVPGTSREETRTVLTRTVFATQPTTSLPTTQRSSASETTSTTKMTQSGAVALELLPSSTQMLMRDTLRSNSCLSCPLETTRSSRPTMTTTLSSTHAPVFPTHSMLSMPGFLPETPILLMRS